MVEKIISGGQTGADQAGLRAAKSCNIATGGTHAQDCRTLDGDRPDMLEEYGMLECKRPGYPARTERNVMDSDGTVRFARDFRSAGEKCTLRFIKWHNRPYFDVNVDDPPDIQEFLSWVSENRIKTLNVAGNSEETAPGIGDFVFQYLVKALSCKSNG